MLENVLLMEPSTAAAMVTALKSNNPNALDIFKRGPRVLNIEGKEIYLNARDGASARSGGDSSYGPSYEVINGVAIIGIFGPLFKGGNGFMDQSTIKPVVMAAAADRGVNSILIICDSPGGSVSSTRELHDAVSAANAIKRVTVYCEDMCASAMYWIACGASAIYVNSTGFVGSIGVITNYFDFSKAYENAGIKVIPIITGKYKNAGDPTQPATADNVSYIQDLIDSLFSMFVSDVSRGRGISEASVRSLQAKIFIGADAQRMKLVDGVMSFEAAWETMRRGGTGRSANAATRLAEIDRPSAAPRRALAQQKLAELAN